ncbi:hypothetical protein ACWC24_10040 [Streptomyces sp. NPDC001443]
MHRTTTLATLLATVAVSALTGCVTVQRPPAADPPAAAPASSPVPRAEVDPQSQVVQAPDREALELVGPRQGSQPPTPAPRQAAPRGHAAAGRAQPDTVPRPPRPRSRGPHRPRTEIPEMSGTVRGNPDLCALGRTYGGWRADSPESAICEQAYGR